MQEVNRLVIPFQHYRSLIWSGNDLVDWVSGGTRIGRDKSVCHPFITYAYHFDHAIVDLAPL